MPFDQASVSVSFVVTRIRRLSGGDVVAGNYPNTQNILHTFVGDNHVTNTHRVSKVPNLFYVGVAPLSFFLKSRFEGEPVREAAEVSVVQPLDDDAPLLETHIPEFATCAGGHLPDMGGRAVWPWPVGRETVV